MVASVPGLGRHVSLAADQLLADGELIAIVDDDPAIREPLKIYLEEHGMAVAERDTGAGFLELLATGRVALVLLDIGLPDIDGLSLLPQIVDNHPDVAIVMLTGVADLHVALDCLRRGADDYLSKPVHLNEIYFIVKKTLKNRRLIFENQKYQEDLETAHFRIQLLHQLSMKMNTVYLSTVELDEILRAILVGITAEEGLRFNRAFLAMFNEESDELEGRMAIGPSCKEEAGKIWSEMREKNLNFLDIVHSFKEGCIDADAEVNKIVKSLRIPNSDAEHVLIKAARERKSIKITGGNGGVSVPPEFIELLNEDTFVVVPLFSPRRSFGVIIADNFITGNPITDSHVSTLELFASQASMAIEHSRLYVDMQHKLEELEGLYHELDKNKNMLVEAERYSALGQMSAQLVHAIRNPVTSIGGISRILSKKVNDPLLLKYLNVMIKETSRLESTLVDLFDFVSQTDFHKENAPLYPLIRRTLMLMQADLAKQNITWELDLPAPDPVLDMDLHQMQQMFLHLTKNAMEAMPDGGNLSLAVQTEEDRLTITITDTGTGISDVHMEKVNDPFFTTKTYGTGMGLAMVERVVKAHAGEFSLSRNESGGITAVIRLPLAK